MNSSATLEDINKAILDREIKEREDLSSLQSNAWEYCKKHDREFFIEDKFILKQIANLGQLAFEKKIKKLAISVPPRFGKSYTISALCAWGLGKYSNECIMRNAYGETLANKFSYDVRSMINTDLFRRVFNGVRLSKSKKSLDVWALNTSKQFAYFGFGTGGTATGYGASLAAIVDDPIKNIEEALSPLATEKIWDWYGSTHKTRKETNPITKETCPDIIISTMWSGSDLINRVIDSEGTVDEGGSWHFISFPALDENDVSICEAIAPTERLLEIRDEFARNNQTFIWETMYQCNVIEKFGQLFPKEDLMFMDREMFPKHYDYIIGYLDPADEGSNYTCSVICGFKDGFGYIIDVVFTQDSYEKYKPLLENQILMYLPDTYICESNKDGRIIAVELRKSIQPKIDVINSLSCEIKRVVQIVTKKQTKNKEMRIKYNSGTIKASMIFLSKKFHNFYYALFIKFLTKYLSNGKNASDDAPDVLAGIASTFKGNGIVECEVI